MKIQRILLLLFIIISFFGCTPGKQEEPELVTFDSVYKSKYNPFNLLCIKYHKSISIEGYFVPKKTTSQRADALNLFLFEKPNSAGRFITVNIQYGYNQNQVERFHRYYSKDDLKVHTNNNEIVGVNQRLIEYIIRKTCLS